MKGLDASETIMPSFLIPTAILQGFKRGHNLNINSKLFLKTYMTCVAWRKINELNALSCKMKTNDIFNISLDNV